MCEAGSTWSISASSVDVVRAHCAAGLFAIFRSNIQTPATRKQCATSTRIMSL
ncbi:hypothetical protein SCLCIDRAFT_1212911 [Scleroderma citrinum Foug A]|uniref:Uncharacterized protein n=1 Tax=Scleroderma citrinum Foug A TaxID=1036808 RepID=A0A0C2ZTH4_9AGAM|nr:hypothetical protein SCLCIDRAFT_1212911 [Scleroderma citrinum Foug A]